MSAQAIWTGDIKFGIVNVGAKLYKGTDDEDKGTSMNELHNVCVTQLGRKNFCEKCNKDVPYSDVVKGVPKGDGTFVVITPDEIKALKVPTASAIVVEAFVPLASVTNPLWVEKSYFVTPSGKLAEEAFLLMRAAMMARQRAAQGRLCIYGREHSVVILPSPDGMILQLMRTASRVRDAAELPNHIPLQPTLDKQMLALAGQVVDLYKGDFDPTDYEDGYLEQWTAMVKAKAAGKPYTPASGTPTAVAPDLMTALKASLNAKVPTAARKVKNVVAKGKSTKGKKTKVA